jgi:hypothetical protein
MTTILGRHVAVLLTIALSPTLLPQKQDAPKEFVGEGVVVAFQKYNRYPVMGPVRGVATSSSFGSYALTSGRMRRSHSKKGSIFAWSIIYMSVA